MCGLVRAGSQFRELFQEIVSRSGLDIEELARGYYIKSRIGYGVWFFKRIICLISGRVFRRLSCLTFLCVQCCNVHRVLLLKRSLSAEIGHNKRRVTSDKIKVTSMTVG